MQGQDHTQRERQIGALATRQHGVITRRQLVELGLKRGAIDNRVNARRLHPVHRGVYAYGHRRLGQRGIWMAAVLASGRDAVLSYRSAAALWGLIRSRWSLVDVTSVHGRPGRADIRLHRSKVEDNERTVESGIPVTSVARTLLDLAEVVDESRLRRAFEEADRLKLLRMAQMERVCAQAGRRKGLSALRRLIDDAREPATTRSPLENRFVEFYREHLSDLPEPQTNVSILDHEVDAYWPPQRLVVEMDSWEFHSHRAAFESDRKRDTAMQAAGYRVIRLTHRRLEEEGPTVAIQLRKLLGE
jgi:very-short-patch-repair endonuclease